jgi:hypothetical protein
VFRKVGVYLRIKVKDDRSLWFSGPLQGEDNYVSYVEMLRLSGQEDDGTAAHVKSLPTLADVKAYCLLEFERQGFVFVKEL